MSNDPLESFVVPNKQTPEPDSLPSMRAASAKPVDTRREPKLSAHTADTHSDVPEKTIKAERPASKRTPASTVDPVNKARAEAQTPSEPLKKAQAEELPAEKTKKELKKTMQAAKQAARQAERRERHRKSRGSRFALYLVFIVAAGFVLAIAANVMIQSMEQLRDARASTAASTTAADQPNSEPVASGPN